ncbi:MAG: bifunctional UDP-3-O-[3-hydroxymyristoyl] N-acetylglucosamine deacetylase/3-hydroxyacyl-ACP dehydratase [Bacteroidia bacterium]
MSAKQHTIQRAATVTGIGLHTGKAARMTFLPAPENHGFVFKRVDLEGQPTVRASVENVVDTSRGTTLEENSAKIHTVEHVLAALVGLAIDNVLIEIDGPETPIMDGSAKAFIDAIHYAGRISQSADRRFLVIDKVIEYEDTERGVFMKIEPATQFSVEVKIDFNSSVLLPQTAGILDIVEFEQEIAPCRTFCFLREIEMMFNAGLIQGGSLENAIVIADREVTEEELDNLCQLLNRPKVAVQAGVLNHLTLHYENEPARHKLLDVVGDLALLGMPIQGKVTATRPGHKANVAFAQEIKHTLSSKFKTLIYPNMEKQTTIFDINAIMQILPHRYPFLLVDKIINFSENSIEGIKNVTINEPFFVGHFDGNPVMPGVLQLEAMAQVGGIMLLNKVEDPKKVWVYFAAIDNARFKKPVIPGDTIHFKLEMLMFRKGLCKMKGEAYVDGTLVCSAELMASTVAKS